MTQVGIFFKLILMSHCPITRPSAIRLTAAWKSVCARVCVCPLAEKADLNAYPNVAEEAANVTGNFLHQASKHQSPARTCSSVAMDAAS